MKHRPELDGVRGIAILAVMAYHTTRFGDWASFGWTGVDLFFVLSGFLITGVLLDGADNPQRVRRFYARRSLRILPLSYAAIIVALVVLPVVSTVFAAAAPRLAANQIWLWTYLANWVGGLSPLGADPFPNFAHFWSLAIEEQFYILWPFVVWHTSRKTAIRVAWGAIIGAVVCRVVLLAAGAKWNAVYFLTPCRVDGLAVGSLIALWLRGANGEEARTRLLRGMQRGGIVAALVLVPIVILEHGVYHGLTPMDSVGFTAVAWAFGALVAFAALRESRVLRSPFLVWFGKYSYGLYVIHPLVNAQWGGGGKMWLFSMILAWLSYHGFEQRFLRLKDRWSWSASNRLETSPDGSLGGPPAPRSTT